MRGLRAGVSFMAEILNTIGKMPLHAAKVSCFLGPIRVLGPARRILPSPSRKTAPPKGGVQDLTERCKWGLVPRRFWYQNQWALRRGWAGLGPAGLRWAGLASAGPGGAGLGADREDRVRMYENTDVQKKGYARACMHTDRAGGAPTLQGRAAGI